MSTIEAPSEWANIICGACQLMDAWKSSDPEIWSEWDQSIRDGMSEILQRLLSAVGKP